jgi:hypothetical protein
VVQSQHIEEAEEEQAIIPILKLRRGRGRRRKKD